jgi:tRNA dimethylallyltransferase
MEWLALLDPVAAARLQEGGGRQRELRALEIALLTGRPLHWWHQARPRAQPPMDAAVFVLDLPRDALYDRINARVDAMVEAGLVEEVRALVSRGYNQNDPGMSATGYPEILDCLEGRIDLAEAMDRIRRATRRYARRQLTWFRNQLPAGAIWLDGTRDSNDLANQVVRQWQGT